MAAFLAAYGLGKGFTTETASKTSINNCTGFVLFFCFKRKSILLRGDVAFQFSFFGLLNFSPVTRKLIYKKKPNARYLETADHFTFSFPTS